MRTLSDVPPGESTIVTDVIGDDAIAMRLMEMGLTEGEPIRVIGVAPWGDPIEVALRGYKLSLRRLEASRVHVASAAAPTSANPSTR